jgi:hypothetical protein
MEEMNINIYELVGSNAAVSSATGQKVYNIIEKSIDKGLIANLNFANIDLLTTAFLNSAIGQLYSKFTSEKLQTNLKLSNIQNEDKLLLKKVTDRAKEYFKDKENLDNIIKDSLGDE